jgi:hypothetical protein
MGFQFGSFNAICERAALIICPLVGSDQGIEPTCYSRNVDIGGTLLFQPCEFTSIFLFSNGEGTRDLDPLLEEELKAGASAAVSKSPRHRLFKPLISSLTLAATCFVHIVAIIMTIIMILHIRSKYTAVGTWSQGLIWLVC